jgi:NADH-quinone oxidoreductase subunit L
MDELRYLSICVVAAPLLGAIIIGLLNKHISKCITNWLACSLVAISMVLSIWILIGFCIGRYSTWDNTIYVWGKSGALEIPVGFLLDRLSAVMISVVTFVAFTVHVYTIGYMHDDDGYQRFFSYILLFTFSMLMLVMANNFAQLFFGWEAVGLLSYLLIGFWYKKDSANFASLKAFLINRVGDLGFIVGIGAILYYFNTLQYSAVFAQTAKFIAKNPVLTVLPGVEWLAISVICISLFIGAMAKSAQVPLHVWLPDSMEGPTPISALIHAATMVTAGIFMVARMSPLFEYSDTALTFVTLIGAITCFFMGILAIVQDDIKRIIAYSTLSQLGYMVVALGVSAYSIAIFHLITHAFFKALLFLGSGSAILAVHHKQNIFEMGNLRKYMPITTSMMLIGIISMIGFPGTSGFFSKDLIIAAAQNSQGSAATVAYYATLITVLFTTIYSFRLLFVAFFGQERMDPDIKQHVHESPKVIWIPLVLLAIPALIAGAMMVQYILQGYLSSSLYVLPKHDVVKTYMSEEYSGIISMFLHGFISWPFVLIVLGFGISWLCYWQYPNLPDEIIRRINLVYKILIAKYGFDAFNEKVILPFTRGIGKLFWHKGDELIIDGLMVNGSARGIGRIASTVRILQTGYLYHYIFIMIIALLIFLLWAVYL